ncbi:putative transcriptional regulator [Saccharomonospora marina XMU15]|uniref:Putative transcriptional regulator n=1 Tax=Saccharomonospora marina XMU15 TaxID=882083 RepID=H5X617_9PSEU|nr:helix-turn-helix transcriptional regulator [Saccharomonospora marina]EHR53416.1 putative transcriptional regulator [Saccharomonospora marina XMU15]
MATQSSSPLADCRHAAGYTQEFFADKLGVDRTTVGRWERGVQSPQPWQRPDLAKVLAISLDHLDDLLRRTKRHSNTPSRLKSFLTSGPSLSPPLAGAQCGQSGLVDVFSEDDAVHAAIPRLRRALASIDLPDDGPTRSFAELAAEVSGMIEQRLQARYVEMAWRLPGLISELARAHADTHHSAREAAMLLTLAFRAADGVAFKFGYLDLSARIIDLMRVSALAAEDPLLVAAVAYVRIETFFATGDLASASRLLMAAADELSADLGVSASSAAAYGALHMRAAVVAGRAGKPDAAITSARPIELPARCLKASTSARPSDPHRSVSTSSRSPSRLATAQRRWSEQQPGVHPTISRPNDARTTTSTSLGPSFASATMRTPSLAWKPPAGLPRSTSANTPRFGRRCRLCCEPTSHPTTACCSWPPGLARVDRYRAIDQAEVWVARQASRSPNRRSP